MNNARGEAKTGAAKTGTAKTGAVKTGVAASEWRSGRMSALLFRARAGDVETQFALAQIFESGHGVVIDDGEAARWYEAAAEGGHVLAQFYLGQMYAGGQGEGRRRVAQNLVLAYVWWRRAADQGHEGARAGLRSLEGVMSEEERDKARGVLGE